MKIVSNVNVTLGQMVYTKQSLRSRVDDGRVNTVSSMGESILNNRLLNIN